MSDDRAELLARRVRWLDRHRRTVAIAVAVTFSLTMMLASRRILGRDWPQFHARLLAVMLGVIGWWLVEVALAWITALWETEADRLLRGRGLPPMRIVRERGRK